MPQFYDKKAIKDCLDDAVGKLAQQTHSNITLTDENISSRIGIGARAFQKWRDPQKMPDGVEDARFCALIYLALAEGHLDLAWLERLIRATSMSAPTYLTPDWVRSILLQARFEGKPLLISAVDSLLIGLFERDNSVIAALPLPEYARLIGRDHALNELIEMLENADGMPFINVTAIGGMGKTALSDAALRRIGSSSRYERIIWISARREWLNDDGQIVHANNSARSLDDIVQRLIQQLGFEHLAGLPVEEKLKRLAPTLRELPYLICIDNLEAVEDVRLVVKALFPLAGQTRFLLTSRPIARKLRFAYVQSFPVHSLGIEDSHELLASELTRLGKTELFTLDIGHQIYKLVGGVPLALKLLAAQISINVPVSYLVERLQLGKSAFAANMFTFIYRETWKHLENQSRELLLSMTLVSPNGEDLAWLKETSGLSDTAFEAAYAQLSEMSLLETATGPHGILYKLHSLTDTFLRTDILTQWSNQAF